MSIVTYAPRTTQEAVQAAFDSARNNLSPELEAKLRKLEQEASTMSFKALTQCLEEFLESDGSTDDQYSMFAIRFRVGDMILDSRQISLVSILHHSLTISFVTNEVHRRTYGVIDSKHNFVPMTLRELISSYGENAIRIMAVSLINNRIRTGILAHITD